MYIINELKENAERLNINYEVLDGEMASNFINKAFVRFKPFKTTGHLSIDNDSNSISVENNEFTYTHQLKAEEGFLFFDQESEDKNIVFKIENVQVIGDLMKECFGIEYFLSNSNLSYLIAVNWYVIEYSGDISITESL